MTGTPQGGKKAARTREKNNPGSLAAAGRKGGLARRKLSLAMYADGSVVKRKEANHQKYKQKRRIDHAIDQKLHYASTNPTLDLSNPLDIDS